MSVLSRRRLYDVLLVLLAGAVLLVFWAGVAALSARAHLLEARSELSGLQESVTSGSTDLLAPGVRSARQEAEAARTELSRPGPALVERMPLIGNTLTAGRAVAEAATVALTAADDALPAVEALREGTSGGSIDTRGLARLAALVSTARSDLAAPVATLYRASQGSVLPGAGPARADAKAQIDELSQLLGQADETLTGVLGLIGGPGSGDRTIVLAVMNNAELRGAGGYANTIAVIRSRDGLVDIGPLQDINQFAAPIGQGQTVPAPPGYEAAYGPFEANTTSWRNVLMSSDGPSSASVLCEVARLAPGVPCDGVVLVDIPALARIATLSGPVTLPTGEQLTGDALTKGLLVDAYAEPSDGEPLDQKARRDGLRGVASDVLSGLLDGQGDLAATGRSLLSAAEGRHLVLWSADPDVERALIAAGLSGATDPDGRDLQLTTVNQLSTGKLDVYVDRTVRLSAVVGADVARVTQSMTLALDLPDGLGTYVSGVLDGNLAALVEVGLARDARLTTVTVDGEARTFGRTERDGGQRVDLYQLVPNHQSRTIQITYEVPLVDGVYRVVLLPQPLAYDATLDLSITAAPGRTLSGGPIEVSGPYDKSQDYVVSTVR